MEHLHLRNRESQSPKPAPSLGTVVCCIHCFHILGEETAASPREVLLARHRCAEGMRAKEPAAPPPFN